MASRLKHHQCLGQYRYRAGAAKSVSTIESRLSSPSCNCQHSALTPHHWTPAIDIVIAGIRKPKPPMAYHIVAIWLGADQLLGWDISLPGQLGQHAAACVITVSNPGERRMAVTVKVAEV